MSVSDWQSILNYVSDLESFIREGMKILGIPGFSIAIVEDSKTVFAKGYGVKALGSSDLVNEDTLMKIGSISKSMTSLLMAKLIDEKKFKWSTPVKDLQPGFKLWDKKRAKHMVMKDLVSGATGLPRKDYPAMLNYKADIFDQLTKIKPSANPGMRFQYNNQLGTVAGYIAAHTALLACHSREGEDSFNSNHLGKTSLNAKLVCDRHERGPRLREDDKMEELSINYQQVMKSKVFNPMHMTRTGFTPDNNYAYPHTKNRSGQTTLMTLEDDLFTDYQAPSTGIWSNVGDMAKYIITELQEGKNTQGTSVFSRQNLLFRRTENISVEGNTVYGYGWCIAYDGDLKYIYHNGNTYGFTSNLMIFPQHKRGIITLTNMRTDERFVGFTEKVFELWQNKNADNAFRKINTPGVLSHSQELEWAADAEFLDQFVGEFHNDDLGQFVIYRKDQTYFVKTPTHTNQLLVYTRPEGQKILCFTLPPFDDMQLVPTGNGGFILTEGEHTYIFTALDFK